MSKPRVAIFDFACCEGCQLQIVNLEEEILEVEELHQKIKTKRKPTLKGKLTTFTIVLQKGHLLELLQSEQLSRMNTNLL